MKINPYLAFCHVVLGLTTWERVRTSWESGGLDFKYIFENKTVGIQFNTGTLEGITDLWQNVVHQEQERIVLEQDRRLMQDWRGRDRDEPVYMNINGTVQAVNPGVHTVTIAQAPDLRAELNEPTNGFEPVAFDTIDIPVNLTTCSVNPADAPELVL